MGNDEERTGGTVGSDQIATASKGDAQETAFEGAPDIAPEAEAAEA